MATHVRKARGDRRNRQDELDTDNRKLAGLRRALGLTADADLEAASPALEAIERVQKLATQGLAHRARITGFEELLAKENRTWQLSPPVRPSGEKPDTMSRRA